MTPGDVAAGEDLRPRIACGWLCPQERGPRVSNRQCLSQQATGLDDIGFHQPRERGTATITTEPAAAF
jgi:hypothetical protein